MKIETLRKRIYSKQDQISKLYEDVKKLTELMNVKLEEQRVLDRVKRAKLRTSKLSKIKKKDLNLIELVRAELIKAEVHYYCDKRKGSYRFKTKCVEIDMKLQRKFIKLGCEVMQHKWKMNRGQPFATCTTIRIYI